MSMCHPTIDEVLDDAMLRHPCLCVLLADDDAQMRALIAEPLRQDGYDVIEAANGIELIRAVHRFELAMAPLSAIITDVRMPGFSGLDVLEYMREAQWAVPVIVITAFGDDDTHERARTLDARLVLDKPFDVEDLRVAVACLTGPARPD